MSLLFSGTYLLRGNTSNLKASMLVWSHCEQTVKGTDTRMHLRKYIKWVRVSEL